MSGPNGSARSDHDPHANLTVENAGMVLTTFAYKGVGLKRCENVDRSDTTPLWDASDHLGEV